MSRRQAREIALQALYQLEINCAESAEQEEMYENLALDTAFQEAEGKVSQATREFAKSLVEGTRAHAGEIDAYIEDASRAWKITRMAAVDRNIARIAVYEMKFAELGLPIHRMEAVFPSEPPRDLEEILREKPLSAKPRVNPGSLEYVGGDVRRT